MNLMDLVTERVKILYEGEWEENQVKIKKDDIYIPRISEKMKKVAKDRFVARKEKNPKLFDGDAFHLDLEHSIVQPNRILLALGQIKYSLYDIARKEYAEKFGWKELPTGMGVCAIILTSDSKIVMHHRASHVDHTAKIGLIGGIYSKGTPFDQIQIELEEELGVNHEEIKKITLIGISSMLDERINHELNFLIWLSVSANQIKEREKTVKEREGEIFFLGQSPTEIKEHLKKDYQKVLSAHFAALVMFGHYLWGPTWSQIKEL